jgi:DNA mismatch repair protein MSH3
MVEAGYKVGVVRQMETAALKAVSTNKSKAFERSLCEVYTKATIPVEDVDILGLQHSSSTNTAVYLLAVCEADHGAGAGSDGSVLMGMMAVDTASGDMVYDEWQDDSLRTELESRLRLEPLALPRAAVSIAL